MSSTVLDTRTRILAETCRLMEEQLGQGVRMGDVARAAGVSRQAVYLHFASRADLLIAAVRYADEVHRLDQRLERCRNATGGLESLEAYVDVWGNYIPEIYGLAKALLTMQQTDQAAAAAWQDRMSAVRGGFVAVVRCLKQDAIFDTAWSEDEAVEAMCSIVSVRNWESLVMEAGWSQSRYVERMQTALRHAFTTVR